MSPYDANLFSSLGLFFPPISSIVPCSRWSSSTDDHSLLFLRHFLIVGIFLLCSFDLSLVFSDVSPISLIVSPVFLFPIVDGLLLVSSKYIGDLRPNITWSSYGRRLLCDSLLRVDLDPLDRVIQPASFTTAGAIWPHPHLRVSHMCITPWTSKVRVCCSSLFKHYLWLQMLNKNVNSIYRCW